MDAGSLTMLITLFGIHLFSIIACCVMIFGFRYVHVRRMALFSALGHEGIELETRNRRIISTVYASLTILICVLSIIIFFVLLSFA